MNKSIARAAVKLYVESYVSTVDVYEFSATPGRFAIRATTDDDDVFDFVVEGYDPTMCAGELFHMLEECRFDVFPPTQGKVRYI
jgi:hypothetical protein